MASLGKDLKGQEAGKEFHKIRITLTTRKVKAVEKVSNDLIASAKAKGVAVRGPVRLPTKNLRINTRKSPNGEGSKTYDAFELRIHKRIIDMRCNSDELRQIANIGIDPSVEIEVTVAQ